ncbi:hypothetical protein OV203_21925 [Nannocystis sp. ILAH1]|uniref:hypothetical protein n=1 Tax=Nannocystis sp. ILAH1 TaxID=2996789 RepID=UPI0022715A2F|nr:hypothetical protein [Nannocystis sp. ILAH1]MCY0989812.1 hypothetical protein [Nannocystis sp. ILAH1]
MKFVKWLGIARAKFYEWRRRYGKLNEHNGKTPRDHWIEPWERQAIVDYFDTHPLEGYRRLTFMMLDDDVVAVSPATAYRVLRAAGRLDRHRPKPSKKGTGVARVGRRGSARRRRSRRWRRRSARGRRWFAKDWRAGL